MIVVEQPTIKVTCDVCGAIIPTTVGNTKIAETEGVISRNANPILGTINIPIVIENKKCAEQINGSLYCSRCRDIYYNELRIIESNYKSLKESLPNAVKRIVESEKD
jgi:hypothetical protein